MKQNFASEFLIKREVQIRVDAARGFADVFDGFLKQGRYVTMTGNRAVESIIADLRRAADNMSPKPPTIEGQKDV